MTLDDVNTALDGRNESDVPLNDNYWKVLNAYRKQMQEERVVEVITKEDVGELTIEDIATPTESGVLDEFLDSLSKE